MFNRDWTPMNATKKTETRDALPWRSRLVRVVPNPPEQVRSRKTTVALIESTRRAGDNAPNLGLSPVSLLFFYEPNA